ncbi:MAG: glucan biosynthesis protein [Rhodobacterales bacterium]|nr:glucan biosynthesis protein [Puniceibacterium antarcticum]
MTLKHLPAASCSGERGTAQTDVGFKPSRRGILKAAAAFIGTGYAGGAWGQGAPLGQASSLTFEDLVDRARASASQPFVPPVVPAPDLIKKIDYSAHWQIRFREDESLYPGDTDAAVQLFHPGRYFPEPVQINLRDENGVSREVIFGEDIFTMPHDSPAHELPPGFGFAGFRVMRPDMGPDWVSFLGASYFRTDGPARQYGLSARGIAIDTGLNRPEEFPRFKAFWLGPPESEREDMSVWAELDGPSITGAYRFGLVRDAEGTDGHVTSVSANLFMRADVERLGIAPLTSMYWYSERDRIIGADWRPEIHDSDGLALATGAGERIWRPLNNPELVSTSSFLDENPAGFGLIQRDHNFDHYQDDGVFYDRRPSAWVRPTSAWGRGAVQLVQIPTGDETFDNIVAYWVPEQPARRGDSFRFDYEIEWRAQDPKSDTVATVVATRQGQGGMPGQPIPEGVGKFVIDFDGTSLEGLDVDSGVEAVVEAANGVIVKPVAAHPIVGTKQWRLTFDYKQSGPEAVSLRAYLRLDGRALTETWLTDAWVKRRSAY